MLAQVPQYEIGGALCQLLHDLRRVGKFRGPNQQVTVLGHEDVADDPETLLRPQVIQGLGKFEFEPVGVKYAGTAIDVRSEIVQMIQAVVMLLSLHLRSLSGMVVGPT